MQEEILLKELNFKATRSSGPGGQHVNKTATKVEVNFNLFASEAFTEEEKKRLQEKLASKIAADGSISMQCGETRSQYRNKAIILERLLTLLKQGIKVSKPRKKTKPSKGVIARRLDAKKTHALKKRNRRPPKID